MYQIMCLCGDLCYNIAGRSEEFHFLSVPDAENKESLSKNGITHILSVYNNAKPVFEVSG